MQRTAARRHLRNIRGWLQYLPVKSLKFTSSMLQASALSSSRCVIQIADGLIHFDTGFLSSSSDLGFNAPKQDRVSFRMSARCAPLHDKKFISGWTEVPATADAPAYQITDTMYGPSFTSQRMLHTPQPNNIINAKREWSYLLII